MSASASSASVIYDRASQGYTISTGGRTQSFLPADIDSAHSTDTLAVYLKHAASTTESLTLTKPGTSGRFTYQYVGSGYWQRAIDGGSAVAGTFDAFAYGAKTADAAIPRTGGAEYAIDLIALANQGSNVHGITGQGLTQVDFASGAVVTHGTLTGGVVSSASFSSEARLAATSNSFAGNFNIDDFGFFSGTSSGRFYGPAAQEIGMVFAAAQSSSGRAYAGAITGRSTASGAPNTSVKALTANQFFVGDAAQIKATLAGVSGQNNSGQTFSATSRASEPLIVNYEAATRSYTVIAPDRSTDFPGGNSVDRGTTHETFLTTTPTVGPYGADYATFVNLRYVASARWTNYVSRSGATDYTLDDIVYGIATPDAAVPRSGSAGYAIGMSGRMADGHFDNLTRLYGFGFLNADFAAGTLTAKGQVKLTEDYNLPSSAGGYFNATATISSSTNSFTGPISFDGLGAYAGTLNGRFYGPSAEEVGATFTASDGSGGVASGSFTGGRDAAASIVTPAILALTSTTSLPYFAIVNRGQQDITSISYDPASHSYSLTLQDTHLAPSPVDTIRLDATTRDTVASTASFSAYADSGSTWTAKLFNPGAANPVLALTYTSFVDLRVPGAAVGGAEHFAVFGSRTPYLQMPRSGSATYAGVAYGSGSVASGSGLTSRNYTLAGTSSLTADFAAASFTSRVTLTGTDTASSATLAMPVLDFSGSIGTNANFTTSDSTKMFTGGFFGPAAEEFGAKFLFSGRVDTSQYDLSGVALGKR